ncbi:hypothetical protein ABZ871_32995 [Streptomyces populi]
MGLPDARREIGWMFALAALFTAVLASAAGFVVVRVRDRQEARGRFLVMAVISSALILFHLFFGVLFPECTDGYHC